MDNITLENPESKEVAEGPLLDCNGVVLVVGDNVVDWLVKEVEGKAMEELPPRAAGVCDTDTNDWGLLSKLDCEEG